MFNVIVKSLFYCKKCACSKRCSPPPSPPPGGTSTPTKTGSCNHIQTVMVKMSSSYRISQTSEDINPVIHGRESPYHTCNHTFTRLHYPITISPIRSVCTQWNAQEKARHFIYLISKYVIYVYLMMILQGPSGEKKNTLCFY